ncbi:MAG: S8 family peptidase [Clostridium sp.]|nr:S8 family peptidase [Clostridium sp.]
MNQLLQLKGSFEQNDGKNRPGPPKLPKNTSVKVQHLQSLKRDIVALKEFWENETYLSGAIISVFYNDVIAKSNRIKGFLANGQTTANSTIVGAKFEGVNKKKHVITHYVSMEVLDETLKRVSATINIINKDYKGEISFEDIEKINNKTISYRHKSIAKTNFLRIVVDSYYVEKFGIPNDVDKVTNNSIVTIYKTDESTKELLNKIGIDIYSSRIIDETTILLTPDQLNLLKDKAPYIISMATSDLSKLTKEDFTFYSNECITIPKPKNEPIVGVIDTMFDSSVYFSDWVEFKNMLSEDIELNSNDYNHGTAVTSIIVDGPKFNPNLDDGCGRFRVKHFGVATAQAFSSFTILRAIKEIVSSNRDIKVWNLSLGSKMEIHQNFISPEAAILDKIQYDNDVIFIVAGTNKTNDNNGVTAIGSPADSINSIVVNSVNSKNKPATYSRVGPVLSFFTKPDISYYGGDKGEPIRVCTPLGESLVAGTSFAAPWITRKMAYLINVIGLSREVAKALLIDSATGWSKKQVSQHLIGNGVVPIKIEDILKTPKDEIKFVISGISEKYDTYNYNLPVPIHKDKHPFIAKATLCYFPCCARNQGVDYTNTELDITFGRINGNRIKSIDNNIQTSDEHYLAEGNARNLYRKWDNIKQVREVIKSKNGAKKAYESGLWGISIKTKERLDEKFGQGIQFGLVIRLKEINGVNRINEFIQQCLFKGWLVNKIDIDNRIDIYNIAEEEIHFDE